MRNNELQRSEFLGHKRYIVREIQNESPIRQAN